MFRTMHRSALALGALEPRCAKCHGGGSLTTLKAKVQNAPSVKLGLFILLGGGFKHFLFLPLLGKIIKFDMHFPIGSNHQLD